MAFTSGLATIKMDDQPQGEDQHYDQQQENRHRRAIALAEHGVDAHIRAGCTSVMMVTAMVTIACAIIALNLGQAKPPVTTPGPQVTTQTQIPSAAQSKFNAKLIIK